MANEEHAEDWRPWGRAFAPASRPPDDGLAAGAPGDTNVMQWRISAHLIDLTVMVVVGGFCLYGLGFVSAAAANSLVVLLVLMGLNWVLLQGLTGWSVGKGLLRLRVVTADGSPPGLRAAFLRTLPLVIEQIGVIGLIAAARSPTRQRIGDRWAHTYVVRAGSQRTRDARIAAPC